MPLLGPDAQPVQTQPVTAPEPPDTATQEQEPAAPTRVITAFVVYQMPNGQWLASEDLGTPIVPVRKAVPDDIIGGAENIKAQVIARKTAELAATMTVQTQLAVGRQMQQQQIGPEEAAALAAMQKGGVPAAFRRG